MRARLQRSTPVLPLEYHMPRRSLTRLLIIVAVLVAIVIALASLDASKTPKQVVKVIPDNALAR